jgi:hypothetical protein
MSKQKIFIIGLIILVSISVILRLNLKQKPQLLRNQPPTPVISQPTQEPQQKPEPIDTSNWKTYRNEKYGFEVRYPSPPIFLEEWLKFTRPGKDIELVSIYTECDPAEKSFSYSEMRVYPFKENILAEEWIKERINDWHYQWGEISNPEVFYSLSVFYLSEEKVKVVKVSPLDKENQIGLLVTDLIGGYEVKMINSDHYFLQPNPKTIIHFYLEPLDSSCPNAAKLNPQLSRLTEQILATFKFIK